jgi:tetratricopeptide (TPR) repeat protein
MKIKYVVALSLMLSLSAYAQKDELKALKKLDEKEKPTPEDIKEYKRLLDVAEPKITVATDEQKAEFFYYKGSYALVEMITAPAKAQQAFTDMKTNFDKVVELEKKGKKKYTKEILEETYPEIKTMILNMAGKMSEQGTKEGYAQAAAYYHAAYTLLPDDYAILYNAAAMALNGQDYKRALSYYQELDKTAFTGEGTIYKGTKVKDGAVETFPNEATLDIAIKTKEYTNKKIEKQASLKPDIASKIALLHSELGQTEEAKLALVKAKQLNPDDISLILTEANIYINAKDYEGAKKAINEAVAKQPNNAELFYSLGGLSVGTDAKQAEQYYKKAVEIKPDYYDAYVRLGDLMLVDEQKLTDQMNALGNTAADNKKYEVIKKQKDANYKSAIGYYEKALSIKTDDQYVIGMLTSLYQAVEMTDKYNAMKARKQ